MRDFVRLDRIEGWPGSCQQLVTQSPPLSVGATLEWLLTWHMPHSEINDVESEFFVQRVIVMERSHTNKHPRCDSNARPADSKKNSQSHPPAIGVWGSVSE